MAVRVFPQDARALHQGPPGKAVRLVTPEVRLPTPENPDQGPLIRSQVRPVRPPPEIPLTLENLIEPGTQE